MKLCAATAVHRVLSAPRARALSQPLSLSLSLSLSASPPLRVSLSEYLSRPLSRSLSLYISRLSQSPSVSLSTCVLPRGCPAIGVPRTPCDDRARPRINGSLRKSIAKAAMYCTHCTVSRTLESTSEYYSSTVLEYR